MSAAREPVHVRTLTMEARRAGTDLLEVTGRLVDQRPQGPGIGWFGAADGTIIHDMRVTLYVRHPDLVITAVTAEMASHPYSVCPDAVEPLQQLVGLSIARGFTRAVNERFGRELGCAHLTALIQAMAPVVRQAVGPAFREYEEIPTTAGERSTSPAYAAAANGTLNLRARSAIVSNASNSSGDGSSRSTS
jgi:hypothetical protein